MRIIGVVDLVGGRAVHARAGRRERYAPVRDVAGAAINGDALALARAYVDQIEVHELYVADLDAITTRSAPHRVIQSLASLGVPIWLDAGVSSPTIAREALAAGATRVIVGLETLPSFDTLDDICQDVEGERVAFSLDLRDGRPITMAPRKGAPYDAVGASDDIGEMSVEEIARRAADSGIASLTVIDLARVGMGGGPDLEMIARVRAAVPPIMLVAGGGVRGPDDLARLADAGCDGALVASALHDGRLTSCDIAAARDRHRSVSR